MVALIKYALACTSFTALVLAAPLTLVKRGVSGVQTQCKKGYFALTFDDGPYKYTEELVDILNAKDVKATFFVNGNNFWDIDNNTDAQNAIKKAYHSGHQIASHTWSHADLDSLSESGIQKEMEQLEDALMRVIGVKPAFMRPPYGNSNEKTTEVLNNLGYTVVTWNVDTKDYETHNLSEEMDNYKKELPLSNSGDGGIALEHDVYKQTVEELAASAIAFVEKQGYKFSTVADCFDASPYQ
ncbi:hypothetical protein INT43_008515 [Umbelopsis isabellina]|uniref:NodB homology domain-containing protein n=1 Tax=Mortierella isabellina TaxID=91625 RepID=A0A8H7UFC6_MORIS|nr:hypothetical protein INT43_008515 [Umbelopsis isabellina]